MMTIECNLVGNLHSNARQIGCTTGTSTTPKTERCNQCAYHYKCQLMVLWRINRDIMDHNYVFICSTEPLHTKNTFRELDFRVIQVLTDSSGTSHYGDSGSILKNRKIGALTYKSELAVINIKRRVFFPAWTRQMWLRRARIPVVDHNSTWFDIYIKISKQLPGASLSRTSSRTHGCA